MNITRKLPILLMLAVVAAGCGAEKKEPVAVESPTPTATAAPTPTPEPVYPYAFPLTGIGTETNLTHRPHVVMVENSPMARPQSGLHKADIVFEILAEGDITRFVSVFHSESADTIGPVRSIRPYFVELAHGLDGVLVHAGWSQDAMNKIVQLGVDHLDQVYGDHAYYWRSDERKAPHNLYTSTELMNEGIADKRFHTEWQNPMLAFANEPQTDAGQPAGEVTIHYLNGYYVSYQWNAGEERYDRYMLGEPHKDKETDAQLYATNLLIAEAKHQILDDVGRRAVDIHGPDQGYLIQNGKAVDITWTNRNGMLRAYVGDEELKLLPGKTWIQIVPQGATVEFQ